MNISKDKVLKRLGQISTQAKIPGTVDQVIDEMIILAGRIITPREILRRCAVSSNTGAVVQLEDGLVINSRHIARLLEKCPRACAIAVTLGKALEEKRDLLARENDALRAFVLDSIGSVAVEEHISSVQDRFKADIQKEGMIITRRFSPGYGDWALEGQRHFLPWLEAEKIGIRLKKNCIMYPEKSISAIVGMR